MSRVTYKNRSVGASDWRARCWSSAEPRPDFPKGTSVFTLALLYTTAFVLAALWLMGNVSSYVLSTFLHITLIVTLLVVLMRVHGGRRTGSRNGSIARQR